jgi:RNA polymerase-binding protein DksA
MDLKTKESLVKELRRQRQMLFKEVADTEADLEFVVENRESEIEERAQEVWAARLFDRLDIRAKRAIEEIDAALQRLAKDAYGTCAACGERIPIKRLRVLPATRFCVDCARTREAGAPAAMEEIEVPHRGPLPPDLSLLTDREVESGLRELVGEHGQLDTEELRIVCRHGVAYLDGSMPSEAEHRMLLKLVTDVEGIREVVDRLVVKEILWERPDRSKPESAEAPASRAEPGFTEDVVKSAEEGIDYVPPVEPPPEEE